MPHELGTDEYLKYLQGETPGELETTYTENVDRYIKESQKANSNQKQNHFSMAFDNPLKGFPYNEQKDFDKNLMELEDIEESDTALKNKAEKTGMPYSILKKVYDRGMAAWKGGHRPGATQQQWAFARVNSFVTKSSGTWGGADKDLAKQVRGSK